jgi:GTP cyclohydrolase I
MKWNSPNAGVAAPAANSNEAEKSVMSLADIQNTPDERNIPIDRVGVRNVRFPIRVKDRSNVSQPTVGTFTLTVDLPKHFKGTHMSRFLEVLHDYGHQIDGESLPMILEELRSRLNSQTAHLDVEFPYFMAKPAPVTGNIGLMEYDCGFSFSRGATEYAKVIAKVPVATLCPCSKEISERGAHNQRGLVTAVIEPFEFVWLEEIIEMIEDSASCSLYSVLKRPDEKFVTEHAYDNPRFVEDVVREVSIRFDADNRIEAYTVEVENFESIHAHNAYAMIERRKSR